MTARCSGLGTFNACEKRCQCANYVHWTDDPRSQFNICTAAGTALKHFHSRDIPMAVAAAAVSPHGQGSLF